MIRSMPSFMCATAALAIAACSPAQAYTPFTVQGTVFFDGFGEQRFYVVPSKGLTIVRIGTINLQYDDAIIPNALANAVK
ncbi:MAG: hypothetical protein ABJP70_07220 [Erythrobacter sp.]